jgi:hypothetical protein
LPLNDINLEFSGLTISWLGFSLDSRHLQFDRILEVDVGLIPLKKE